MVCQVRDQYGHSSQQELSLYLFTASSSFTGRWMSVYGVSLMSSEDLPSFGLILLSVCLVCHMWDHRHMNLSRIPSIKGAQATNIKSKHCEYDSPDSCRLKKWACAQSLESGDLGPEWNLAWVLMLVSEYSSRQLQWIGTSPQKSRKPRERVLQLSWI